MDATIRDYKMHTLQTEYNKYSKLLFNFQCHIERCYIENIINISEKNNYQKILNDILRQMNTTYNTNMMDICGNNSEDNSDDTNSNENDTKLVNVFNFGNILNVKSSNMFDEIRELVNLYNILRIDPKSLATYSKYNGIFDNPFDNIKTELLDKIASKIGFYNISEGLELLIGNHYNKLYDENTIKLIKFYKKVFIPIGYSIRQFDDNKKDIQLFINKVNSVDEIILTCCAELCIQQINSTGKLYYVFKGFFVYDSLNIIMRTSQVCNNFIYQKKKTIETHITSASQINDKFVRSYIRNINTGDILSQSKEEFLKQIETDYQKYNKLVKLTFMNLMKEFVKDVKDDKNEKMSIMHMYNIIKLLLLGSDENINVAGLLYGITKEKKPGAEFSISDIIYKNINYISQIKLKKTSVNIKSELDKIKSMSIDDVDLKKQIAVCSAMPLSVKKAALEKVEEMKTSNNEYYKQLLYVKTLLNFPWPSDDDDLFFQDLKKDEKKSVEFLDSVIKKLDDKVYGHNECKGSIKEIIGKWISNPSASGSALGLVGNPGTGKTILAKSIGDALGIPFVQITLGGQNDGEILHGHGYTYSGAQPGMIVKKMVEAGSARCVMYFDELDKACKKHDSNEIHNILIHLIDPNTNNEFQDRFFQETSFNLNKVLFIFSYNDSSLIDKILLDRIKEIEVHPYKTEDKKAIIKSWIIPEMSTMVGFNKDLIGIDDESMDFIVSNYTYEAGVRDLKRKFEKIFLKLNIDKIYRKNLFKDIKDISENVHININKEIILEYLGKKYIKIQEIHTEDTIGMINGLYATDAGKGGVLPIQIVKNFTGDNNKFTLKLTGSQKKIMRESVIYAFTTAINIIKDDIRDEYIKNNPHGFHIHTPSGAVPKDGPSAGCAFATAFVSQITNKKIRHDVAMTGEIELTGKVTKIGGLHYKLTGAKRAGVKLVLVSKENSEDVEELQKDYPEILDGTIEIKLIDTLRDVLSHVLVDFNPDDFIKKI